MAQPGESCFGRLSVLCDWLTTAKILFEIPADAFLPKPKVTSAVVQLMPRKNLLFDCRLNYLERVTKIAFNQRRKMLRASFKKFGGTQMLTSLNIDPMIRPQDLSTESFCKLANHLGPQLG